MRPASSKASCGPTSLPPAGGAAFPLILLNARMSDRSFIRWRRAPLVRPPHPGRLRPGAGAQRAGCRTAAAARRARRGQPRRPEIRRAASAGRQAELDRLRSALADRPVWLAASTHPGEEAMVAAAHRRVAPRLSRPADDHRAAASAIAARRWPRSWRAAPRRRGGPPAQRGIWIADTMGELGLWYRLAPIAFVGRSLVAPGGGQNPLEPARLGCAIAVGPPYRQFRRACRAAARCRRGLVEVADAAALAAVRCGNAGRPAASAAAWASRRRPRCAAHADLPRAGRGRCCWRCCGAAADSADAAAPSLLVARRTVLAAALVAASAVGAAADGAAGRRGRAGRRRCR